LIANCNAPKVGDANVHNANRNHDNNLRGPEHVIAAVVTFSMGVLERRGAGRPRGTFAEAPLAVPPSRAGSSAAAPGRHRQVVLRSAQIEDDLALRPV
jgi:hypothetical protein